MSNSQDSKENSQTGTINNQVGELQTKTINFQVEELQNRVAELAKWQALHDKPIYKAMRLGGRLIIFFFIVSVWALLFTPAGSYFGVTDLWDSVIELAAASMNPACPALPNGEACMPGMPEYDAYIEAAERARGSLQVANRNLITVLMPLFLGLAVWLITIVAEKRLKNYDEKLEQMGEAIADNRVEVAEAPDKIRKNLQAEIDLIIKGSLTKATDEISNQSEGRQNEINKIKDDLEARFKDVLPYLPENDNGPALYSVGVLHKKVTGLFGSGRDNNSAKAIHLTRMAFGHARPYAK